MVWVFKEWYDENKEDFNAKRRARYQKDKKYRELAKKRAKKYYNTNVKKPSVGRYSIVDSKGNVFYTINKVALAIRRSRATIHEYHRIGIIPEPLYYTKCGWRLYTKKQVVSLYMAFREYKLGTIKDIYELSRRIRKHWNDE